MTAFENELGVQAPVGFWDPAGLSSDGSVENFKRRRQTELKHGRISMLATMGYITPGITGKFPGCQDQNEPEGSDEDLGPIRRGRPRNRTRKLLGEETRSSFTASTRQVRSHKTQDGQWTCPVCHQRFNKANQFAFHYEAERAVADPSLVTVQSFPCSVCGQAFRRQRQYQQHVCPAKQPLARLQWIDDEHAVFGPPQAIDPHNPTAAWFLFTDGSGGTRGTAGWGSPYLRIRIPTLPVTGQQLCTAPF